MLAVFDILNDGAVLKMNHHGYVNSGGSGGIDMKILVALDDSSCSEIAFESVMDRKWSADTEFKILSVAEPLPTYYEYATTYPSAEVLKFERQHLQNFREMVAERVASLKTVATPELVSGDVTEGTVATEIIEKAKNWKADLIIVGSHGRKGIQKFFLGSVAEKVVSGSPCSVEVVKDKRSYRG